MPSPVSRMYSAASDCEGYHILYPSYSTGIELDFPAGRSHTAPNPELAHDTEQDSFPPSTAITRVPKHTGFGATRAAAMGNGEDGDEEEDQRIDSAGKGDTIIDGGEERGLRKSRHEKAGIVKDMTADLTWTPRKRCPGRLGVDITADTIMWTSSSEIIPGWANMTLFRGSTSWRHHLWNSCRPGHLRQRSEDNLVTSRGPRGQAGENAGTVARGGGHHEQILGDSRQQDEGVGEALRRLKLHRQKRRKR